MLEVKEVIIEPNNDKWFIIMNSIPFCWWQIRAVHSLLYNLRICAI